MKATTIEIARICHEVNRAYCQALGDDSVPSWDDCPDSQAHSIIDGVHFHLRGEHGPEASHEAWMDYKLKEGWVYGEVKDADAKTHPCLVPFSELPKEQQAKDFIFRAIVNAIKVNLN